METLTTNIPITALDAIEPAISKRRNGKVARLSKELRDLVNNLLFDGATYSTVIDKLKEHGIDLNHENVSNWFNGGFQDWLKERQHVDAMHASFELVTDMLENTNAEEIPDMMVKLLAARVGAVLVQTTPNELKDSISDDPKTLAKIFSLIPRLSRESLRTRKYRREVQREDAQELKQRDPNRSFGDETDHRAVVNIVDKVLGLGQYTPQWIQDLPTANFAEPSREAAVASSSSSSSNKMNDHATLPASPSVNVTESPCTSVPTQPATPKWIPVDQRPWNWPELSEYGYMSRFPPDDYQPPTTE